MIPSLDSMRSTLHQLPGIVKWGVRERSSHYGAILNRMRLSKVTFVGITGSAGKTTAKDFAAAILATLGPCNKNSITANEHYHINRTVLKTKPGHRFCVIEASATRPGYLDHSVRMIRPRIAALTLIAREHYSAYGSLEAIASEKEKLIAALPPDGIAVLNIDDPLVRAVGERHHGRILWVGRDEKAELRLLDCHSRWPDPLTLRIEYRGQVAELRMRQHGKHLAMPIMIALGIGLAAGASFEGALAALAEAEPPQARMQVEALDDGVTFVRDDWKAPQWSLQAPFDFLADASAMRKIAVIGSISDSPKSPAQRYAHAARDALKVADLVVLVGTQALKGAKSYKGPRGDAVKAFTTVRETALFLREALRPGDLVLLKGTAVQDHLARLYFDRREPVQCWRVSCGWPDNCDSCGRLYKPMPAGAEPSESLRVDAGEPGAPRAPLVVGLGNASARLFGTPHNVGYRAVEALAGGAAGWTNEPEGQVTQAELGGVAVTLFKPGANINVSGRQLQRFLARTRRSLADCVIVYDDMDLELGTLREKRSGGDGGHKGVKSIIATLSTDEFLRLRIGTRPPGDERKARALVLSELSARDEAALAQGVERACSALAAIVARLTKPDEAAGKAPAADRSAVDDARSLV